MTNNNQKSNEVLLIELLKATDEELTRMYVKGTNKFATKSVINEMKQRGIY
jgi:hypothetical protein